MAYNKAKEVTASEQLHAAKPLLVLLHGTTGFSEDWSGVIGSLPDKRVVIRPDYMNSKLTAGTAYTSTMAEAASRVLSAAAATSESPFDLVGYSLGASVAAFIAAEHPEVVRSLVLISGFAYGGDVWMKLQFNLWLDLLRTDRIALTRLLLLTGLSRNFVLNMDEDTIVAAVHAFAKSSDWESIQHAIQLDLNVDVRDHVHKIAAPTLLVTAKHDRIVPEFYSQQLARLAVRVQRAEIDSGHLSFLEHPATLATTISTFVDSLAAPNRTGNGIIRGRVSGPKEVAALIEEAATHTQ
jgi:pimeloyl-ACP methyl ester carboxylesterase